MILTGRAGNVEVQTRTAGEWPGFAFGANPLTVPPPNWMSGSDRDSISGIPAADAAVRIASEAVAGMCPGVFRGDGLDRMEVNSTWQARFFNGEPNVDEPWESVWQQTEASLTAERNAFWWLMLDGQARVASIQVIDPSLVRPKRDDSGQKIFEVQQKSGRRIVGTDKILHFRGPGAPGAVAAPNPVDVFCDTWGAAIHRTSYESEFYQRGLGQAIAVTFPAGVNLQDARAFQEAMLQSHGGAGNQHKPRVFGNGAQITTIGISPRDAQFIEGMGLTVEEVARIYNVPLSLLGGVSGRNTASPLTPEHEMTRWLRYGLAPRLSRIAAAINHHPAFFGVGSRDSFDWETGEAVKGDVATEDLIAHQRIQDGRITVNEWRASKGLPPLTGGDVPQITPVGGAPNPGAPVVPTGNEPATEPAAELDD